jgi:hypothetical protein
MSPSLFAAFFFCFFLSKVQNSKQVQDIQVMLSKQWLLVQRTGDSPNIEINRSKTDTLILNRDGSYVKRKYHSTPINGTWFLNLEKNALYFGDVNVQARKLNPEITSKTFTDFPYKIVLLNDSVLILLRAGRDSWEKSYYKNKSH